MELKQMKRKYQYGTVLERMQNRIDIPKNKDGTNSKSKCWNWIGPTNNAGYGMIKISAKHGMGTVHRAMYIETYKTVGYKDKVQILHKCGNKLCVNPDHLFVGNYTDRGNLQRKYKAYNKNFHNKKYMYPVCEHCGGTNYLPHFKRLHSLCASKNQHK